MRVIVPCLGRPKHLRVALQAIRDQAGMPIELILAVDGDESNPWHYVVENTATGHEFADQTIVVGSHKGNGATLQAALTATGPGPFAKIDSDVVPSQVWLKALISYAQAWDDGKLGCLIGLPTPLNSRTNVGPRRYYSGRRLFMRIVYFTERGAAAIPDHTTIIPINGHDKLVSAKMHEAGLWIAYCHAAAVEEHLSDADAPHSSYITWKAPYLAAPSEAKTAHLKMIREAALVKPSVVVPEPTGNMIPIVPPLSDYIIPLPAVPLVGSPVVK